LSSASNRALALREEGMTTPNITVTIEPVQNGMLQFLKCAPAVAGDKETGQINVILTMTNNEIFPDRKSVV
jgi:hypothetical protein